MNRSCYDVDIYECLEDDLTTYYEMGHIILMGDFNSRIGRESDTIINDKLDKTLLDHLRTVADYECDSDSETQCETRGME